MRMAESGTRFLPLDKAWRGEPSAFAAQALPRRDLGDVPEQESHELLHGVAIDAGAPRRDADLRAGDLVLHLERVDQPGLVEAFAVLDPAPQLLRVRGDEGVEVRLHQRAEAPAERESDLAQDRGVVDLGVGPRGVQPVPEDAGAGAHARRSVNRHSPTTSAARTIGPGGIFGGGLMAAAGMRSSCSIISDTMSGAAANPFRTDLLRLPAVALRLGPDPRELGVAFAFEQLAA